MAASMVIRIFRDIAVILLFWELLGVSMSQMSEVAPSDILEYIQKGCFVAVSTSASPETLSALSVLSRPFLDEERVTVGMVDLDTFVWPDGRTSLSVPGNNCYGNKLTPETQCHDHEDGLVDILLFKQMFVDRTCLLEPVHKVLPSGIAYDGALTPHAFVEFVNQNCQTFRSVTGHLTAAGLHKEEILSNVYKIDDTSATMKSIYSTNKNPFKYQIVVSGQDKNRVNNRSVNGECTKEHECDEKQDVTARTSAYTKSANQNENQNTIAQCDSIHLPISKEYFFENLLKKSKPVIIKDAARAWPAFTKWTQDYLRELFGHRQVHVKMTPGGDFEGVESAELWEDYEAFKIPPNVFEKIPYPDLVVVRPAGVNMNFSDFLDVITWAAVQPSRNVSAYLEYSSIPEYMPELEKDISEFEFASSLLTRRHLNIWLSDGNTVGRLHFDPYDNFLCQLKGTKQVIMFEPFNNTRLYEAHIPQATLGYRKHNHEFRRKKLEDSTSMVMSPVDLLQPHFERFPEFADTQPLNCTIEEGDVLFMPSFWWHEVHSLPNTQENRNLAINYWYEPFLTKEFPCAECKMDINPHYYHLL